MKFSIPKISLLGLLMVLAACHPGMVVQIVNETGGEITVVTSDREGHERRYVVPPNEKAGVGTPFDMRIEKGGIVWTYAFTVVPPPRSDLTRTGRNVYMETLIVRPNGMLYCAYYQDANKPVLADPQPDGFPLSPPKRAPSK